MPVKTEKNIERNISTISTEQIIQKDRVDDKAGFSEGHFFKLYLLLAGIPTCRIQTELFFLDFSMQTSKNLQNNIGNSVT